MRQTLAIARYTALEALRTRTAISAAAMLLLLFAASFFIREIAIADSHRLQTTFLAATARLAGIFIASLFIISAVVREFNDKGQMLLLSLALGRGQYVVGKFLGFLLPVALMSLASSVLVALVAGFGPTLTWAAALLLESAIMSAVSLFCALSLRQTLPSAALAMAFYLLARGLAGIQLIAHHSLEAGGAQSMMTTLVDGLGLLLPRLDAFAASRLLVETVSAAALGPMLAQAALYCALALAAASIDFARRDL